MSYWKTGQLIQRGKYVIEKVLGAGGAGVTYRAKDTFTEQTVAIKTLNAMIQAQPDFSKHQERFVQEAFRLAKCSHPHVIRVDDVCKEGELWCMVMEYITGGNLEFLVKKKGGLSEHEAVRYISQVGSALAYIHQQGILHRDVKPANIMRRPEKNEAVLIDFGLARDFIEDKTQIHTNSRTEGFAPLEQYQRSAKRGCYTDVYALAATLYYLVTVQIPFPAQFRNQGIQLVPPKQHNPEISDRLNQAILKGMELQPEYRPQSIPEWLSMLMGETEIVDLDSALTVQIVSTPPVTPPSTKKTPSRTTPPLPPPPLPGMRKRTVKSTTSTTSRNRGYDPLSPQRFTQPSISNPPEVPVTPFVAAAYPVTQAQPETNTPPSPPPTSQQEELKSSSGFDYTHLQQLLAQGKWREADQETNELILKVAGKEDTGFLDRNTMRNFPCDDLQIMDRLWVKYSKGRFGFSVQKRIYQSLGGKREYDKKVWEAVGDRLGWRVNQGWLFKEDLNYTATAPQGHLPSTAAAGLLERGIYTLASRGMDCNI
jgi:serine/threonine protein kinase